MSPESPGTPLRVAAIIPVGPLEDSKSRLGGALDAEERLDLASKLLARTVGASLGTQGLHDVLVVSPDREALRAAAELGARTLRQRSRGLNAGLTEARDDVLAGGAEAILVLPIDLAFISSDAIESAVTSLRQAGREPVVLLVSDRRGTGTNTLGLSPPDLISFAFGPASRNAHRIAAERVGARFLELDGPLTFDIDTPADLMAVQSPAGAESRDG
jgi:2-phospho-L-lactate guanylyltransferase